MRRKITQYLSVLLVISLSVALSIIYPQGNARAQGSSISWGFSKPSDYHYDTSLVDISGGIAKTRALPLENGWWTKTYDDSGSNDQGRGVSCDAEGNSVVAGYFNNGTDYDIWVRKYRGSDGATLWTKTYNGGPDDEAYGVSCDAEGNPVVVGYTVNGSNYDVWVRKYRGSDGATLWTKTYDDDTHGNDIAYGVSCDAEGNPVVTGYTYTGTNSDIWVRKYRGSDGATLWTKTYDDSGSNDQGRGVSCDPEGNPVVVGYTVNGSNYDVWVRKYRGSDGATLWTKTYDGGHNDAAFGVSYDPEGNPVVAGVTLNGTNVDVWARKYRGSDGATLWTKTYDGGPDDEAYGVSCDADGNPVVAGFTLNGTNADVWVRKYRGSDGATLWTKTYDGGHNDAAFGVSCDAEGNPVVAGFTNNGTNSDIWVRKYPPGNYATHASITSKKGVDTSGLGFTAFSDKAGTGNLGSFSYELSGDGIDWYYYSGGWTKSKTGMASESNPAAVVSQHIGEFSTIATSKLYVRVFLNSDGMQKVVLDSITVDLVSSAFYFAEGTCRPGFDPYLCIQNPGSADAEVTITYMKGDGSADTQDVTVPKNSRSTVIVKDRLGEGDDAAHDFSAKVECTNGQNIIAERPMYFNYKGEWTGGHDVVGALAPAKTFYFAEGTCRPGFDPYLCIQNPGSTDAAVKITYMKGDGTTDTDTLTVGKNSRSTVTVKNKLGEADDTAHDFSAKVECTNGQSIIAERPMYFNYKGIWTGGHDVVGALAPAKTFYFAEGTCRPGFDPYICIQNPGSTDAEVTITYMKGDGTTDSETLTVGRNSRSTVTIRNKLGEGDDPSHDFSAKVECTNGQSIIAERPMYFNYKGMWTGGHDVVGFVPAP